MRGKNAALLAAFSLALTMLALGLSVADRGFPMFVSYFAAPLVLWMNWLPVFLLLAFFFLLLRRLWLALLLTGLNVLALALVNHYKLTLRNDPLLFADLTLVKEAAGMTGRYAFSLTLPVLLAVLLFAALVAWAYARFPGKPRASGRGLALRLTACAAGLALYALALCPSPFLYRHTANYGLVSEWSPTGNYVCRGVLYPFFHSLRDAFPASPEGYDPALAAAELARYPERDIPEERKVDVVAVMLEAFNDFGTLGLDFVQDPFLPLRALERESYCGQLVTNVFAGETVNTERAFLTGYLDPSETFRRPVNSYVRYLRGQGYACEGGHPGYNWFYNRLNVNEYLGFQRYSFYEDRYHALAAPGGIADDDVFLPSVLADYRAAAGTGTPYFGFFVTYQNHGPYFTDARYQSPYLAWRDGYTEADYNIANNYLDGIAKTCRELAALAEGLRREKRPVVLVLFGDHNPWWGDGNATYRMFGVNLDVNTEEGFYHYYCTPYLIWGNDAAKALLGDVFTGDHGRMGPYSLMGRLFSLCGWQGPAWMQALRDLEKTVPFANRCRYLEGNELLGIEKDTVPERLLPFKRLEYYTMHAVPEDGG